MRFQNAQQMTTWVVVAGTTHTWFIGSLLLPARGRCLGCTRPALHVTRCHSLIEAVHRCFCLIIPNLFLFFFIKIVFKIKRPSLKMSPLLHFCHHAAVTDLAFSRPAALWLDGRTCLHCGMTALRGGGRC